MWFHKFRQKLKLHGNKLGLLGKAWEGCFCVCGDVLMALGLTWTKQVLRKLTEDSFNSFSPVSMVSQDKRLQKSQRLFSWLTFWRSLVSLLSQMQLTFVTKVYKMSGTKVLNVVRVLKSTQYPYIFWPVILVRITGRAGADPSQYGAQCWGTPWVGCQLQKICAIRKGQITGTLGSLQGQINLSGGPRLTSA